MPQSKTPNPNRSILQGIAIAAASILGLMAVLVVLAIVAFMNSGI
jgi:hypothetical protein